LKPEEVDLLMEDSKNGENARISIDLERQIVQSSEGIEFSFEIDEFKKHCLLNGLDDIGLTMEKVSIIDEFEENYQKKMPWV
jgi:3-isopropylmalate/(R)-2-methylmalate dehydratase small subunit